MVRVLDADPDLAREMGPSTVTRARVEALAPLVHLARGRWIPPSREVAHDTVALRDAANALVYHQTIDYGYDKRGLQTLWQATSGSRSMRRSYYPNGLLAQRHAVAGTDDRGYTFAYDPNGSLTQMVDVQKQRTTNITVDPAERQLAVNETWASGKDTAFEYDPNGNVTVRHTDGVNTAGGYQGGKTSTFTYDPLDRETKLDVAQGADTRTTTTDYWPSGDIATRTAPGKSVETRFYDSADLMRLMRRQAPGTGQVVKDQAYEYDTNGNRKEDERGTYQFNPRNQLDRWQRSPNGPKPSTVVTYAVDGSGQIESETDNGTTTTYSYIGDQLRSATRAGVTTSFTYDDFGATKTIDAGPVHTKFDYDPFERLIGGQGPGAPAGDQITYDALDRRDTKKQNGTTVADYSYIGLSESMSREQSPDGSRIRSYDYDADGQRLGQAAKDGTNPLRYRNYSLDADGSVEGLEDDTGAIPETRTAGAITATDHYYYDPFGRLDTDKPNPATPADADQSLSPAAKDNPFRYQGFYTDPQTRTQDMHARVYGITQARFLTQDRYEDALGDLNLVSDPTTNNRYAFLDANPISNVEQDGHYAPQGDHGPGAPLGRRATPRERQRTANITTNQTVSELKGRISNATHPPPSGAPNPKPHSVGSDGPAAYGTRPQPKNLVTDTANAFVRRLAQDIEVVKGDLRNHCGLAYGGPHRGCPSWGANAGLTADIASVTPVGKAFSGAKALGGRALARVAPKLGRLGKAGDEAADTANALCSFTAATPVLMADGTTKPISQIHEGDRVLATDPQTGKHYARTVTRVWIHTDTFIHLTIDGESLTVTEDHRIWDATDHAWERAEDLDIGDLLTTADGRPAHVTAIDLRRTPAAAAYNLTVDQTHTYHAGQPAVLVHNTCGAPNAGRPASSAVSRKLLGRQLASDQQMAGAGTPIIGRGTGRELRDAPRLAREYGGDPGDWVKMSSSRYRDGEGIYDLFETHWYENIRTGARTEFKTKFPRAENAFGGP